MDDCGNLDWTPEWMPLPEAIALVRGRLPACSGSDPDREAQSALAELGQAGELIAIADRANDSAGGPVEPGEWRRAMDALGPSWLRGSIRLQEVRQWGRPQIILASETVLTGVAVLRSTLDAALSARWPGARAENPTRAGTGGAGQRSRGPKPLARWEALADEIAQEAAAAGYSQPLRLGEKQGLKNMLSGRAKRPDGEDFADRTLRKYVERVVRKLPER